MTNKPINRIKDTNFRLTNASRFPGVYPDKPKRGVFFTILIPLAGQKTALYFVNRSDEILRSVRFRQLSSLYQDDEQAAGGIREPDYEKVLPREAVKLDEYDLVYDSDYWFYSSIAIVTANGQSQRFELSSKGVPEAKCFAWWDFDSKQNS